MAAIGQLGDVRSLSQGAALWRPRMKHFKCRSSIVSLISLFWISGCVAEELRLSGTTSGHDQRTGKPVLKLEISEASRETLRRFGADNSGQKVEFLVRGQVTSIRF